MKLRIAYSTIRAVALMTAALGTAPAQTASPFASGLQFPSRIIVGPNGNLLVAEATAAANTGRISLLDRSANRRTVIDGLPCGTAAPDFSVDGPNGLALSGRTLYIANGEGDSFRNGPTAGTIVPNPDGPSSPMYSTILKVTFSGDVDQLGGGFSLKPAEHFTLMDGATLTLNNGAGDTASVSVVAFFRTERPDAQHIYRNTHLYSLALLPSQPNALYVADAGNNLVWQVDLATGRPQVLSRFANTPNPIAPIGPPFSEAVPTSVRAYGSHLLVTLLSGVPFVPGTSRVMELDPATGNSTLFIAALSSTTDLLFRVRANGRGQWFVLQYSLALSATPPAPGRLLVYDTPAAQVLLDGLKTPTGMALDETTGDLYVLDRGDGTVLKVNVGN